MFIPTEIVIRELELLFGIVFILRVYLGFDVYLRKGLQVVKVASINKSVFMLTSSSESESSSDSEFWYIIE